MASNNVAKNRNGGKYKYTDIAQIHEWLEEQGISYYQYIERIEGDDYIYTVPFLETDGGLKELPPRRGCRVVQASLIGISNPAQEQGSALTYARRYSLLMAFGLATEDDDAQSLSKPKSDKAKEEPKAKAEPKQKAEPKSNQDPVVLHVSKAHVETMKKELERTGLSVPYLCNYYKVKSLEDFTMEQFKSAMANFSATKDKAK